MAVELNTCQDAGKIKEDLEAKEAIKEAERKKREKIEDQKARAAIKAQIEVRLQISVPPLQTHSISAGQIKADGCVGGQEGTCGKGRPREGSP